MQSTTRIITSARAIVPLTAIFLTIFCVDSFCHSHLPVPPVPHGHSHFLATTIVAFFVALLLSACYLRTRKLSKKLRSLERTQAKENWTQTFNSIPDFVSVHDRDATIIKVNQALCDFLGKSPDEILGQKCYRIFHNRSEPYPGCPHLRAAAIAHPVTELISDDTIGVPLLITCSPLLDEIGQFHGSVHIARTYEERRGRKKDGPLIPICASCKCIRTADNRWIIPEEYFTRNTGAQFTHSLCKECQEKIYPDFFQETRE